MAITIANGNRRTVWGMALFQPIFRRFSDLTIRIVCHNQPISRKTTEVVYNILPNEIRHLQKGSLTPNKQMSPLEVKFQGKWQSFSIRDGRSDVLRRQVNLDTGEIRSTTAGPEVYANPF